MHKQNNTNGFFAHLKPTLPGWLRIQRRATVLKSLVVPFTAHIASVLGIAVVYYARSGSLKFEIARVDIGIAICLGILTLVGFLVLSRNLPYDRAFVVKRADLNNLIQHARDEARHSVHSFAGDVTWLNDDREALLRLMKKKPVRPTIRIYYDPTRLKPEQRETIRSLSLAGIELFPYPVGLTRVPRCLIVDKDDDERRVFTYERKDDTQLGRPRDQDPFLVREYTRSDAIITETVSALATALHLASEIRLRIALTGVNNTGKTTLSRRLRTLLEQQYGTLVQYIGDQYRADGGSIDLTANLRILYKQLLAEHVDKPGVFVYDRSSADNLCYLKVRALPDDSVYAALAPTVASVMQRFDLIVRVVRGSDDSSVKTKNVEPAERRAACDALNRFFDAHGIQTFQVSTGSNRTEDYDAAAAQILTELNRIILKRRTEAK